MMQKDNITIKKMEYEDVPYVADIEKECFSVPWSKNAFYDELKLDTAVDFVAHYDNMVAGFINGRIVMDEFYINNVAVIEKLRHKGIASLLIEHLENYIKATAEFMTLEVRESNIPAQCLYKKHGFNEVGKRKNFYEKPTENALIMTKYFK